MSRVRAAVIAILILVASIAPVSGQTLPQRLDLGSVGVGEVSSQEFDVAVPPDYVGASFEIDVEPPFSISPRAGVLGRTQRFTVSVRPKDAPLGVIRSKVRIRLNRSGFATTDLAGSLEATVEPSRPRMSAPPRSAPPSSPPPPPPSPPSPPPPPPSRAPASPSKPTGDAPSGLQTSREASWNAWVEQGVGDEIRWDPVDRLETSMNYSFVVELALAKYFGPTGGFTSAPLAPALADIIRQLPHEQSRLELEVLLLAEPRFITLEPTFRPMSVNVDRLRAALSRGVDAPPTIAFEQLRNGRHADLKLASDRIRFRTTGAEGTTSLAVSIWHRGVPVDEFAVGPFCVVMSSASRCATEARPVVTFAGLDSGLSPAINRERVGLPLGALHLVHVDDRSAFGVLSRADRTAYTTWQLDHSIDEIARQIKTSVNQSIVTAAAFEDPAWLEEGGRAIANLLLLGNQLSQGPSPSSVLVDMMKAAASQTERTPPALFVRAVAKGRSPLLGIPLALANLPLTPPAADREFIGFKLRIEMPLEDVVYDRTAACIAKWVVLAPPADDPRLQSPLKDARTELDPWLERLRKSAADVSIYESVPEFAKWASRQADTDLDSTAVVIVSHHDGGRLYMSPSSVLPAANIQRQLRRPAAVILSACGTAEPGGTDVMRNFVLAGANAVVGTGTEVEGRMAGKFVSLLLDDLQARSNTPNASLGQSTFAAIQKLRRATFANGTEYGAFALLFGLSGDAGLQLCLP